MEMVCTCSMCCTHLVEVNHHSSLITYPATILPNMLGNIVTSNEWRRSVFVSSHWS